MSKIWDKYVVLILIFLIYIFIFIEMSNKIDLTQFNQTKVIKKLTKSKSNEDLKNIIEEEPKIENAIAASSNASFDTRKTREAVKQKRGRKSKYMSQEERLEARRLQQKEYRLRKKQELEELKKIAATVLTNKE